MASKQKKHTSTHGVPEHASSPADVSDDGARGTLGVLVAIGVASALWALFQWGELLVARAGGDPFCALGDTMNCAQVWDSAFASAIHKATGLPVAGWGLVWGLVALALPLAALVVGDVEKRRALVTATRITGLAGVVSVVVLAVASLAAKALCIGCLGTYVVVLAYAAVSFFGLRSFGMVDAPRGVAYAGALTVAFFLVLLVPGLRTPKSMAQAGRDALPAGPLSTTGGAPASTGGAPAAGGGAHKLVGGAGTGDATRDQQLRAYLASLDPEVKQMVSNFLGAYLDAPKTDPGQPRAVVGDAKAPILLTEWTDVLCGHCAQLHTTVKDLAGVLPAGTFKLAPRHFPLDGTCNPNMQRRSEGESVRCVAAKAQICLEKHEKIFDFSGALFENQQNLTVDKVYELAAPLSPKAELQACVGSAETAQKLADDIAAAMKHDIQGTPLVLLNGKMVTPFPPVLFALLMTGGEAKHPAFEVLPAPKALQDHHGHVH